MQGYRGSGNINPDSAELTKKVKEYMVSEDTGENMGYL
jgi:hypothetical protein